MANYDANFASPPAPIARVTIRNTRAGKSVTDYGVFGRDVLNLFRLVFDGPRKLWDEIQ